MNGVNKTLYIPLYGKAQVSQKGIILHDPKAEQLWAAEGFALGRKARSKWLAYYMGMRAAVFDDWVRAQLAQHPDAVVLHLGCGLDSRAQRVSAPCACWYDVDFPEVIAERSRWFDQTDCYRMVGADVLTEGWLQSLPAAPCAVVVMEGISMYLPPQQLQALLARLSSRFGQVALLLDCYTPFAAKASRYKNPINEVGVTQVYGMDDPAALQQDTGLQFVQEHSMTPAALIGQLQGAERRVFQTLYAGRMARRLYRMYEYRKP